MSDIRIVLRTERRSGILAGAIASLRRSGLRFKSQRLIADTEGPLLVLEAEGELAGVNSFTGAMRAAPGIVEVMELTADGGSLTESHLNGGIGPPELSKPVEPELPEAPESLEFGSPKRFEPEFPEVPETDGPEDPAAHGDAVSAPPRSAGDSTVVSMARDDPESAAPEAAAVKVRGSSGRPQRLLRMRKHM